MLDDDLKSQLKTYLGYLKRPVVLSAALDETPASAELSALLADIAQASSMIRVEESLAAAEGVRRPSFAVHADNELPPQLSSLEGPLHFETYFSQSCQNCPDVVQALNLMAARNPRITHTAIDGALFQAEVTERQVMAVPTLYLNGERFGQGRMELE